MTRSCQGTRVSRVQVLLHVTWAGGWPSTGIMTGSGALMLGWHHWRWSPESGEGLTLTGPHQSEQRQGGEGVTCYERFKMVEVWN